MINDLLRGVIVNTNARGILLNECLKIEMKEFGEAWPICRFKTPTYVGRRLGNGDWNTDAKKKWIMIWNKIGCNPNMKWGDNVIVSGNGTGVFVRSELWIAACNMCIMCSGSNAKNKGCGKKWMPDFTEQSIWWGRHSGDVCQIRSRTMGEGMVYV